MKILSIIGARPQFVKEAMMQQAIREAGHEEILVHTGQHFDENMSGVFFDVLKMEKPNYNLGIHGKSHGEMTGEMIIALEKIMCEEKPDVILLYGDTDSTLAGAIAASKLNVRVAHIEAGLRQEPKTMPEEINRVLTDRVSDFLFVPSPSGMSNLNREGLADRAYFTGDVMYDIFLKMQASFDDHLMEAYQLKDDGFILVTMHRDFNVDDPDKLKAILSQLGQLAEEKRVVWPMHPRTRANIERFGYQEMIRPLDILPPIDYLALMGLLEHAAFVVTDSGGFQKESYFAGKRAVVVMPDTSWRELTDQDINVLAEPDGIVAAAKTVTAPIRIMPDIYGDGQSARRIIDILEQKGGF